MSVIEPEELSAQFGRIPPSDIEAEMCFLASLMLEPEQISQYAPLFSQDAFFQADHGLIFRTVCETYRERKALDPIILREALQARKILEEVGGTAYLAQIISTVPSAAHIAHYAAIVAEKWRLRQLITAANEILRKAYSPTLEEPSIEIAQQGSRTLADIGAGAGSSDVRRIGEIAREVYQNLDADEQPLYPFGFIDLDEATGGGALEEMIVIGARPSMGKSTLIRQIGLRSAMLGIPTLLISLEESAPKIGRNLLSAVAGVENRRLRKGRTNLIEEEWNAVGAGVQQLQGIPLYVTTKHRRLSQITGVVHAMKARYGIVRVLVDYLQRIPGLPGKDRYEKVTNGSLMLSELFKVTQTNGVVACQLNRANEAREDKRPTMSDLRESGQIEQDADGIILLHREDYYHTADPNYQPTHVAELWLAKWRDAARGECVKLISDMRFQRFEDSTSQRRETDAEQIARALGVNPAEVRRRTDQDNQQTTN